MRGAFRDIGLPTTHGKQYCNQSFWEACRFTSFLVAFHTNPYRCSSNSQFSATITYIALVMRRRVRSDDGRGGDAIPATLESITGMVPATMIATRHTSGLVPAAVAHWPCASATVAVVRPQNGHGTPVSARSGHGIP